MFVKEIWRYPAKSMAGEQVEEIQMGLTGFAGDRRIVVTGGRDRLITARSHPGLLGLKGAIGANGKVLISRVPWDSPEALAMVRKATGEAKAELVETDSPHRFDILPLLVATDGAIAHMGFDGRRLRPNIVIGGVTGLAEREWPGKRLQIGSTVIEPAQLRGRCVMTTYDPDTLVQDRTVLKRIVSELGGVMALDTAVITGGLIGVGDEVTLLASGQ